MIVGGMEEAPKPRLLDRVRFILRDQLAVEQNVSASTQTQALSALVLLYDLVLHRPLGRLDLIRAAKPRFVCRRFIWASSK